MLNALQRRGSDVYLTDLTASAPEPMRTVQLARPFNRLIGTIPKSALSVPSMMSLPERRFLYGVAKDYYRGDGVIVDAGIFLGASFADVSAIVTAICRCTSGSSWEGWEVCAATKTRNISALAIGWPMSNTG